MNDKGAFSPLVIGLFAAAVTAIFALSALLNARSGSDQPYQAGIASRSALGHAGLYELLKRLDLSVAQRRIGGEERPQRAGVLVLAEPDPRFVTDADGLSLGDAANVLVVLPKWRGTRDDGKPGWVGHVTRISLETVRTVLDLVTEKPTLTRVQAPKVWSTNSLGVTPGVDDQVQLLRGGNLRPIVGNASGMLVGELRTKTRRYWILADPDPLQNHGLVKPENARFAKALFEALRGEGLGPRTIVFDETIHGVQAPDRNPLQLLFTFPFVVVTLQILVALALLLLATTARFGGTEREPPAFDLGKRRLIGNMAAMLDRAGHQAVVLRRYLLVPLREAGVVLHAPQGLDDRALAVWLDRIGSARGLTVKAADVLAQGAAADKNGRRGLAVLFAAARDIHRWHKDLLNGPGTRQDRR